MWTFKLRPNVKFHNGQAMTANDVVYTFKQLSDPKVASNALSAFTGVLTPAGVTMVDATTVAFHLEAPNGNFPYLVSSDNYNAIIVPDGTNFGTWQSTFIGTGPFTLKSYTQNVSASFTANPNYWGGKPFLDGSTFTFYASQPPQILALQGGQVDGIVQFTAQGAQSLLNGSTYNVIKLKSAGHRELSMRNDQAPFTDSRVRQAVALAMGRPQMITALLLGAGQLGNDSPFGPRFPSTDTTVPQRAQDIAKAKQLLSAAGHPNGFSAPLVTEQYEEIPALAQVMKADLAKVGITANLKVEPQTAYYGKATYGNSDWLDSTMSLVDYGDRGAPNVYLAAPLTSDRPVERGPLQEQDLRQPGQAVRRGARPLDPEAARRQDRDAAAGGDADRGPVFRRRPDGDDAKGARRQPDIDRGDLSEQGVYQQLSPRARRPGRRALTPRDDGHLHPQATRSGADHAVDSQRDRVRWADRSCRAIRGATCSGRWPHRAPSTRSITSSAPIGLC